MKHITLLLLFMIPSIANAFVLGPTTPGKWGDPTFGTGADITYSFMAGGEACDTNTCSSLASFMPTGFESEIIRAFDAWSSVANLTFTLVADGGEDWNTTGTSGDMRFGGESLDGAFGTLAHGYFPPANGNTAAGDIHFDSDDLWEIGADGSGDGVFDIFTVALHEIGHALGLGHEPGILAVMNPFYAELGALQADDIAGIQFIYGAAATGVPEPGALLLLAMGIALFGARKIVR